MRRLLIPAVCATLLQAQPVPVDTPPVVLKQIKPVYPAAAMRARIEGLVGVTKAAFVNDQASQFGQILRGMSISPAR